MDKPAVAIKLKSSVKAFKHKIKKKTEKVTKKKNEKHKKADDCVYNKEKTLENIATTKSRKQKTQKKQGFKLMSLPEKQREEGRILKQ